MGRFALVAGLLASAAGAQDWRPLVGEEIAAFLTDREVGYDRACQRFFASGRTLYNAGQVSWGYWQVRGDRYCSQWPPSGLWDCYLVQRQGTDGVRFVGPDGSATTGTRRP